jgi:glycosyltransferase involved in cell wall biosynthesis
MRTGGQVRVLVAGLSWPPETFLARLLGGLADAGLHITVATGRRPDAAWLARANFAWLPVPDSGMPAPHRLLRTGAELGRVVVQSGADLRRALNGPGERGRLLPFVGRSWDVVYFPWNAGAIANLPLFDLAPVVVSCRGAQVNIAPHNPERAAIRDGLRETFGRAAAVHCVSAAIRDEAAAYGLDPEKAVIIRPAVDPAFFHPSRGTKPASDHFRLVTTGSLIWRKGYETMLLAVRRLLDRGVPARLTIVGDGPERQRVLYTIHDLELVGAVELAGRQTPDGVRSRLLAADAFVLSSLSEGISNAVLEAMACGLPVVTTSCGGMAEAVGDGVEGYLVPSRDPQALADALAALWADPAGREALGRAGRARIERDFDLAGQLAAFDGLFREVAAR